MPRADVFMRFAASSALAACCGSFTACGRAQRAFAAICAGSRLNGACRTISTFDPCGRLISSPRFSSTAPSPRAAPRPAPGNRPIPKARCEPMIAPPTALAAVGVMTFSGWSTGSSVLSSLRVRMFLAPGMLCNTPLIGTTRLLGKIRVVKRKRNSDVRFKWPGRSSLSTTPWT